jgi:CRISPR-associated protein Cas8a1/Csx13
LGVFREANQHLGLARVVKLKDGQSYAVPASRIPELVAANLAGERHWCTNFRELVSDKQNFARMFFSKGGLKAMKRAIKDADDQAIIRTFHEAWRLTMGEFGERARQGEFIFEHKVETEREKIRNAILRAKTANALAAWFLRFCADATKGNSLSPLRDDAERIRKFIFNQRNFDRFQNLCLFALVSYTGDETKNTKGAN